jgi:hypothetical protein
VWRRVAVAALVSVVMVLGVEAHGVIAAAYPKNALAKFDKPRFSERIVVINDSIYVEPPCDTGPKFFDFEFGIHPWSLRRQSEVISWTEHPGASGYFVRKWKFKVLRKWVRKGVTDSPVGHLVTRCQARARKQHPRFEPVQRFVVLRDESSIRYCQIGSRLEFAYFLLAVRDPFIGLDVLPAHPVCFSEQHSIGSHGCRDALHSCSYASPLGDCLFHIGTLLSRDLIHFGDGLAQLVGLIPKNAELQHENRDLQPADKDQPFIEFDRLVLRRTWLAVSGLLGGFFLSIRGWQYSHDKRRLLGAALIAGGWLLGAGGLGLLWLTAYSGTWNWLL